MSESRLRVVEGALDGGGLRVRVVASKYNRAIVDALLAAALETLRRHGVRDRDLTVVRVPGAFEIPLALARCAGDYDAQIALGCVVRGETAHFDQVVNQCSRGVMDVMMRTRVPVAFGVLAVDEVEHARARSGSTLNRGEEAALAAIESARLMDRLDSRKTGA